MPDVDVVVVGAGLAGLRAADRLVATGARVAVLEARDRVGGRAEEGRLQDGTPLELGGMWLGPTQTAVHALVDELGLETFAQHAEGRTLLRRGTRWTTMGTHRGAIPRVSPATAVRYLRAQRGLDRLAQQVPLDRPWDAPDAAALDRRTFGSWLDEHVPRGDARRLWEVFVRAVFAAEPDELSLLHVAFYVGSGDDVETLQAFERGAQERRVVGGTWRIAAGLAARVGGHRIHLGHPVRQVRWGDDGVVVTADTPDGGRLEVSATRAIVALPPTLAGRLAYAPGLPAERDQLTQQVPMGAVTKVFAAYPTPFWRDDGYSGQAIDPAGPVSLTVDASPPSGAPGVLLGFLEADHARELSRWTPQARRRVVLAAFARAFGTRAADPVEVLERDWAAEPYSRGCYGGHLGVGVWTRWGPALRRPVGPLHWAGTETAERWSGYFDGAVRSGERAAAEALTALELDAPPTPVERGR